MSRILDLAQALSLPIALALVAVVGTAAYRAGERDRAISTFGEAPLKPIHGLRCVRCGQAGATVDTDYRCPRCLRTPR